VKKQYIVAVLVILLILIADQALKIWVKTNMMIGEQIPIIGNSIMLYFIENPGMAFGMEIPGLFGKLILSIFRLVAIVLLSIYLHKTIKKGVSSFFVICIAMVIAGAAGNLIDSAFYGLIFSESTNQIATLFPQEGGYAQFMHGHVVDMFYCPVIDTHIPESWPFWASKHIIFFRPVFNIADSAITVSVILMIIFYRKVFRDQF
jgi:signal peptidase II